jgi:hypothetical protein
LFQHVDFRALCHFLSDFGEVWGVESVGEFDGEALGVVEGDVVGVEGDVVKGFFGEAAGLVVVLLVEDSAELDLEVDLVELWF